MNKVSLDATAREQRKKASTASSGRAAETVYGEHEKALRQTVIALTGGTELNEHRTRVRPPPSAVRPSQAFVGRCGVGRASR